MSKQHNTNAAPTHGYWKSLRERADGVAVKDLNETLDLPVDRRDFFGVMGASLALAGVAGAGCRRYEKEEIVPLSHRAEGTVPGQPLLYATVMELGGVAQPLVATSYEGRPIKLDGNPDHPFGTGGAVAGTKAHAGSSVFAQASVLGLYDPDRSQRVLKNQQPSTLDAFSAWVQQGLGRVRVLTEATTSVAVWDRFSTMGHPVHEWEAISWDNEREGLRSAFGKPVRPIADLAKAKTIVALDCDLFGDHPAALKHSIDFARSRKLGGSLGEGQMNRLWAVESVYTTAGAMADHRVAVRSEHVGVIAMALDAAMGGPSAPVAQVLTEPAVAKFVSVLAAELTANRGRAVLLAGRRQPPEVHALVAKINSQLAAPVDYVEDARSERPSHLAALTALTKSLEAGEVDTLVIVGGNPVFDAPADLNFGAAMGKAKSVVHLSETVNETSAKATWHIPRAHFLESWTDARTLDGTITLGQPLIQSMYGGLSAAEFLALLAGSPSAGRDLLAQALLARGHDLSRKAIHDGFVAGTALTKVTASVGAVTMPLLSPSQAAGSRPANGALEVVFLASASTYDGRFANNAWLQETPEFLTKVTWDNYAMVAPATAQDVGIANDDLISVSVGGTTLEIACYTMPGMAKGTVAVVLGGGRRHAGNVGGNDASTVGFDAYPLRKSSALDIATGATVKATGRKYVLASTQEHWDVRGGIDESLLGKNVGAEAIQERVGSLVMTVSATDAESSEWKARRPYGFQDHKRRGMSLYQETTYANHDQYTKESHDAGIAKHAWAMAIDLSTCVGCNSCVVACQAENNIPVVGKEQVINNREMHWMRIDRYFEGGVDDPRIAHQPIACQHCENAPCEKVCPVGATVHSSEGLNDMAYNRCVGTRYCLNNCPYRVRRFNFLDYHKEFEDARNKVRQLVFNPEVTVRSRGVMEKCTFCVQRIQNGKIQANVAEREGNGPGLRDGDIVTACQAACPSEAIVFGDLADPTSRVSKLHADRRAYGLLDPELYTKPRTQFLARVRNPNPALEAAAPAAHQGSHS